jgi:hypothetical protein
VLSRFPIVARNPITNETYSIGSEELSVQRGFLNVDIQVNPEYRFRLLVAHLKSKLYNPLGQTEMRRNEARLLNKHVRRMLNRNADLNLVVVGDMNDTITSAALRELIGSPPYLMDLRPADFGGRSSGRTSGSSRNRTSGWTTSWSARACIRKWWEQVPRGARSPHHRRPPITARCWRSSRRLSSLRNRLQAIVAKAAARHLIAPGHRTLAAQPFGARQHQFQRAWASRRSAYQIT